MARLRGKFGSLKRNKSTSKATGQSHHESEEMRRPIQKCNEIGNLVASVPSQLKLDVHNERDQSPR